jgi:hypothetical protein
MTVLFLRVARHLIQPGLWLMGHGLGRLGRAVFMLGRYSHIAAWWCECRCLRTAIEREQQWMDDLGHKLRLIKAGLV